MPRVVTFRQAAQHDATEAFNWYEDEQAGLGHEFLHELDRALVRLRRDPELPRLIHRNARKARLERFPYWLIYVTAPEKITVVSVFHCSRNPSIWQRRLRR